jgi:hypothetical protein
VLVELQTKHQQLVGSKLRQGMKMAKYLGVCGMLGEGEIFFIWYE